MVDSRIGFRVRKLRRQENTNLTLPPDLSDGRTHTAEEVRRVGRKKAGCGNVGLIPSRDGKLEGCAEGEDDDEDEEEDGSRGRKAEACEEEEEEEEEEEDENAVGDRASKKRKLRGRGSSSSEKPICPTVGDAGASVAKTSIDGIISFSGTAAEEEVAGVSVTSLFEPAAIAAAINHLKESDSKLRAVIETHEVPSFQKSSSSFLSLVRSIVYQQLATKAASAIYNRLISLCGGDDSVTPSTISALPVAELRSIGISLRKASYLHDLARNFLEGNLSDSTISLMEDGILMSTLTNVRGIGAWSVHMFMIFTLHRPDVLPVGDLGVRKGFQKLYNLKSLPTASEMEQLAASWRPYRSLGSWYMWRLIGTKAPVATSVKE